MRHGRLHVVLQPGLDTEEMDLPVFRLVLGQHQAVPLPGHVTADLCPLAHATLSFFTAPDGIAERTL